MCAADGYPNLEKRPLRCCGPSAQTLRSDLEEIRLWEYKSTQRKSPKKEFVDPQRLTTTPENTRFQNSRSERRSTATPVPSPSPTLLPELQLVDLLHAPLVSATFEIGLHPDLDDPLDAP